MTLARFHGRVDFTRLREASSALANRSVSTGAQALDIPGIELEWDRASVDVVFRGGIVALAIGRARDEGAKAGSEAERWLERYRLKGDDAAQGIGGGFAAAIVDCARSRVLLLVDRFSIETLCYRAFDGEFIFADAANAAARDPTRVDSQAIYDYFFFHVIPGPRTAFVDVRRIEPAHAVVATAEGARTKAYWRPVFVDTRDTLAQKEEQFLQLVERCVGEEADEPQTACFLSGGTDSSTVAGMLARVRGAPIHAYSIGFDSEGYDEMAFADIAAKHFGLVHHAHYITPDELADAIPKLAAAFDQPFGNSSVVPAYLCALRAREDGFMRLLAGDGGDELFAGNSRYALQKLLGYYEAMPRMLRSALEAMLVDCKACGRIAGLRQLRGYVRHASSPLPDRMEAFNLLRALDASALFEPSFIARVDTDAPSSRQRETWRSIDAATPLDRLLVYDWKYTLADNDLPKVRTATRLAGVEVGYPLLGLPLTDLSLTLPANWKLRRFELRWFFKRALAGFLPRATLRKKKHGFGLPFGPWLVRHDRLRAFARDALEGISHRGIVRPAFTRELFDAKLPQAPHYYGEMIWILMMLEHWLRAHDSQVVAK